MEIKSPGSRSKEAFPYSLERGSSASSISMPRLVPFLSRLACIDNHIFPFASSFHLLVSDRGAVAEATARACALSDQYHGIHLDRGAIYLGNNSSN